jgi:autotransporter-like protein
MNQKLAKTVGFIGFGCLMLAVSLSISTSPALAVSAGCTAANSGTFTTSAPANTNVFRQFNTTFDIGDTLFATATGTPLGVGVDIQPGLQTVLVVNGANGSGSTVVNNAGPHTVDVTLAGGPGGSAFLNFSCTATSGPPTPPVTTPTTPDATDQSDTATNTTTTSVIVEDGVVNGIIGGASQEDPTPVGPTQAEIEEEGRISRELYGLRDEEKILEEKIKQIELKATIEETRGTRIISKAGDYYEEEAGELIATLLVPMDIPTASEDLETRQDTRAGRRILAGAKELREQAEKLKEDLVENRNRQTEIEERLKEIPDNPNDFTPDDLEDLGDGENILFVGRDPFARALMRYRGFRLDVADTGEGFSDSVKPLSFTQTLSSTIVGWVRAVYTDYEQNDASQQDGDNILVALGIHKDFNDDLRIGLFATTTWGDVQSPVNALDIDSQGYSLGTYGRYKWGEIDLNATARIGLTDNDISVGGTTGSYDTRLASFTFGISGQEQLTDSVWMRPAISLTNTWVNREDYTNSAGTNIGGNTTWSGNVSAGPTIGTSLTPPSGFKRLEPAIGLQATYTYSDQDTQAGSVTTSDTDYLSLSVSPQLSMEFNNGASLDVFGSYFGIGADLDGWSVGGTLSIPLN